MSEAPDPDWRALLVRYMAVVLARESWSYLSEEDWSAEDFAHLDAVHTEATAQADTIDPWG